MKYLIVLLFASFTALANISIDPGNGDIVYTDPVYGIPNVRGNIFDMYSIEAELRKEAEAYYECSNAIAAAGMSAKPVAFEEGLALGAGLGGSGSCGAAAVAMDYMINDTLSYNIHFSKSFQGTQGTDAAFGAGLHIRF